MVMDKKSRGRENLNGERGWNKLFVAQDVGNAWLSGDGELQSGHAVVVREVSHFKKIAS